MTCILCQSSQTAAFKVQKKPERDYFHCAQCDLIFMHPEQRLGATAEKSRYDAHENEASAGYQAFLSPLVDDVLKLIGEQGLNPEKTQILDFGCGPQAFLSVLFQHKNIAVTNYDLFYRPDQDALRMSYHAVTSTEVWEHLFRPREEISHLVRILKPGGILAVMTSGHRGEAVFHDWHYRRDMTHVTFYSEKTMGWIANAFGLKVIKSQSPYWVFLKS